jgi:hypothetical protein
MQRLDVRIGEAAERDRLAYFVVPATPIRAKALMPE